MYNNGKGKKAMGEWNDIVFEPAIPDSGNVIRSGKLPVVGEVWRSIQ